MEKVLRYGSWLDAGMFLENVMLAADARGYLVNMANGDARQAITMIENTAPAFPFRVGIDAEFLGRSQRAFRIG